MGRSKLLKIAGELPPQNPFFPERKHIIFFIRFACRKPFWSARPKVLSKDLGTVHSFLSLDSFQLLKAHVAPKPSVQSNNPSWMLVFYQLFFSKTVSGCLIAFFPNSCFSPLFLFLASRMMKINDKTWWMPRCHIISRRFYSFVML